MNLQKYIPSMIALKNLGVLAIIMLLLDAAFLYSTHSFVLPVYRNIQKMPVSLRYGSMVACYVLMVFGLYYFILRERRSILDAFLLGVLVYGVYDMTIYTIFTNYTLGIALMDMLWGGVLFAASTAIHRQLM
jgi:uncharacterized membrane protein